jgi:HK97 gp10 family phage protein
MIAAELKLSERDIAQILKRTRGTLEEIITAGSDPLVAAGEVILDVMRDELRQPGQGEIYECEFRMIGGRPVPIKSLPREPHQASAPGDPPASDTETLVNALDYEVLAEDRIALGVKEAGYYWRFLEEGTRFIDPRPFVEPAIAIAKRNAAREYHRATNKYVKSVTRRRR